MKFALTFFLSAIAATASAMEIQKGDTLTANSKIGKKLLSKARRLENDEDDEAQMQWVADYSLKFQGCHHLVQWNAEADDEEDVRLAKKRLVRFRLCPSDSCSEADAGGCDEGYGDYIVDMNVYLQAYYETKREYAENVCGGYVENYCNCDGDGDDNFDEGQCNYECVQAAGMTECYDYMEDLKVEEIFQVEEYMECAQFEYEQDDNRRLDQNEAQYFVGPFCSEQGGSINLGMFSDETCSMPIEDETYGATTFKQMAGITLPYSEKSLIGNECLSCLQVEEDNDRRLDQNEEEEKEITEVCQQAYMQSGKCESQLASGTSYYPNENACNYMEGIKVVREDGMVFYQEAHADAVTTAFIVIFAIASVSMGVYVWYLRTRLNIKTDTLL